MRSTIHILGPVGHIMCILVGVLPAFPFPIPPVGDCPPPPPLCMGMTGWGTISNLLTLSPSNIPKITFNPSTAVRKLTNVKPPTVSAGLRSPIPEQHGHEGAQRRSTVDVCLCVTAAEATKATRALTPRTEIAWRRRVGKL